MSAWATGLERGSELPPGTLAERVWSAHVGCCIHYVKKRGEMRRKAALIAGAGCGLPCTVVHPKTRTEVANGLAALVCSAEGSHMGATSKGVHGHPSKVRHTVGRNGPWRRHPRGQAVSLTCTVCAPKEIGTGP